ncbi:MAG: DUF6580 family putative transport protein [Candidatus Thermoplasmatota archaeon]|nr:DUF6580 family putative transport protein [Candidatus Thermoplasmatota archaeon]
MDRSRLPLPLTAGVLLLLGAGGRIALHGHPNVETVMVATFLAAMLLPFAWACTVTMGMLLLSDWWLGYLWGSPIVAFTYSGFLLVALASRRWRPQIGGHLSSGLVMRFAGAGVVFAVVYDGWTNFGVFWLWWAHTPANLLAVYTLGLPFILYHLLSSIMTFTLVGLPLWLALSIPVSDEATAPIGDAAGD